MLNNLIAIGVLFTCAGAMTLYIKYGTKREEVVSWDDCWKAYQSLLKQISRARFDDLKLIKTQVEVFEHHYTKHLDRKLVTGYAGDMRKFIVTRERQTMPRPTGVKIIKGFS